MLPRANWKGSLKIAELTCPVALYSATSTSDRIAFHTINRATGHRVRRTFIDSETGKQVESGDQIKGYEVDKNEYVTLEPEEIAQARPQSDKALTIDAFLDLDEIDNVYFDKPYYLSPSQSDANELFVLIREGLRKNKVAAIAKAVLFRRSRTVLISAYGEGLLAFTLSFDYEVRSAQQAFDEVPDVKIQGEMLQLAKHIIDTKRGAFDPSKFEDRYEQALAEFVKAKLEGKPIAPPRKAREGKVINLLEAFRESAALSDQSGKPAKKRATPARKTKTTATRRKAS
ncbi:Ku protein [Methylocystis sp. B8]|uniref:non-homologous end joining protein Ku n=1 Tax=Methylocystis sp. B8 TaxID=544938 RepID=UPI0010FF244B|nr:Ku protein [Methylocystis sp. B8]TLG77753.1 Ku protein [Methylocystis sp. B8]